MGMGPPWGAFCQITFTSCLVACCIFVANKFRRRRRRRLLLLLLVVTVVYDSHCRAEFVRLDNIVVFLCALRLSYGNVVKSIIYTLELHEFYYRDIEDIGFRNYQWIYTYIEVGKAVARILFRGIAFPIPFLPPSLPSPFLLPAVPSPLISLPLPSFIIQLRGLEERFKHKIRHLTTNILAGFLVN